MNKTKLIVVLMLLFLIGCYIRLTPHPANFTPLGAIALFAGVYLPKKWAVILPVVIMFFTDIFLGFYDWRLIMVVYSCFILIGLAGLLIRKQKNILTILTAALGSSLFFFIATNLAVWLFSNWYPHNFSGLMLNYALAIPFFRNSLMGDLFFTGVIFGIYELVLLKLPCPAYFRVTKRP